jgi:hypothetical protein
LASVLPAGARIIPDAYGAAGTASAGDRTVTMQQRFLAYTDPLAKGIFRVDAGGPPRAGREVTLTSHLACTSRSVTSSRCAPATRRRP